MENQDRIRNQLPLKALILLLLMTTTHAACPSGISGKLRGLEHDVSGEISISEDCILSVESFSYDGKAPQVFWWGAPDCSAGTLKKQGARISDQQLVKSYKNGQLSVPLLQDIDWSNIGCVTVYCEEFYANLGDFSFTPVDVKQTAEPSTNTPTLPPSLPPPSADYESVDELTSCTELIPGYFNLHWEIDDANKTLVLGLEGRPGTADSWLGFGFSPPDATGPQMIGSNVVVAGMVKGKCFAYPYFLSSQSQCDFDFPISDGVCPDFAGQEPLTPTKLIDVLACERKGDKLSVLMKWPLRNSDDGKNNVNVWPTDGSFFSIYAMGPISEGSNSTIPVVLYHNLKLPGTPATASITSDRDMPLKINFSAVDNNCRTIVPAITTSNSPSNTSTASPVAIGGMVATIDGPTTFNITIGSNENYPNPPAWGYSLWVNKQESPVVVVRRGTPYTFNIAAGPTHPVYITSSIIGGGLLVDFEDETIFAGNDTTVGTPGKATTFIWTPDEKTPDLVYYQCVVHQKLGWEIKVVDAGVAVGTTAAGPSMALAPTPASAPASDNTSSTKARCTVTIQGKANPYNACIPLTGVGKNFNMAWNLVPSTSTTDNSNNASSAYYELSMGFNATSNGWVAVAFPENDGQMVGSSSMVLKSCATCPSGAEIGEYYLGALTVSGVKQASDLNATELEASFNDGMLSGKFKIRVPRSDATVPSAHRHRRRSLRALDSSPSNFPFIFAAGDLSSNGGNLQHHSTFGSTSVDISIGQVTQGDGSNSSELNAPVIVATSSNGAARTAHMWLMAIGFGVFIPMGIVIARFWSSPKSCNPKVGFNVHRAVQTLGFLLGVAGIVCGFIASGGWNSNYVVHRNIGMAVIVLCFLQILALVWRPKLDTKLRRPWAFGHRWLGRIIVILAISNIYYGIIHVAALGTWAWATYTAILGVILVFALGKESIECAKGKRSAGATNKFDKDKSASSSSSINATREV